MRNKDARGTVWFIHPYSVPPEYPASTRHYYLGTGLAGKGWDVRIWQSAFIHPLKRYHDGCGGKLMVKEKRDNISLYWLWGPSYEKNDWRRSLNMLVWSFLIIAASLFQKKPGLVIASSPHIFGALAGLVVGKLFRVPFILEVRDLWPDTLTDMGALKPGLLSKLLYKIEKKLYKESNKIIALTEGIKQIIVEKGIDPAKVVFIPNGICLNADNGLSTVEPGELKKRLGLENKFVCVYTGAHGPANALDVILDAASYLKAERDIVFLLVGAGQEKSRLIEKARENNLVNIVFHDPVPRSEINGYIKASDLCILILKDIPVFNTALPNKLFDYMYENKPILCALTGETADIIQKENLGLVIPPGSPGDMAESILILKNSPGLMETYGGRGRKIIEDNYSFEKLSVKLEEVIAGVIEKE